MDSKEEFQQVKPVKSVPAFAGIAIYIGLFLILSTIFGAIVAVIFHIPLTGEYSLSQLTIIQSCMLVSAMIPAYIVLYLFDHRSFSDLGLSVKGRGVDVLWGMLAVLVIYAIGFPLSLALGVVEVTGIQLDIKSLSIGFVLYIMVALTEEIMVRGYILGRLLRTRLNRFASLGISSLLFSLMHFFNPDVAFLPLFNILLAGLFLGASYLYTRNLWFPISLHLFWNFIQGPVLGYKVSGQTIGESLLSIRLPENNILNGGTFGFEGSILCTFLLIIATAAIIWHYEKKGK